MGTGQLPSTWAAVSGRSAHRWRGQAGKLLVAAATALLLGACKVVIVVPEGGRVVSTGGVVCEAGETCEVEIATTSFTDTFQGIADEGYSFDGWLSGGGGLCGGTAGNCIVSTVAFAGIPQLEELVASNASLNLSPVFTAQDGRYDSEAWADLLGTLNNYSYRSDSFLYSAVPNTANCTAGSLTAAARQRFLDTLNLIRELHYLPPVSFDASFNAQSQQSALVQEANNYLTHYPAPGDACYTAAAAAGAGSSNLSSHSYQKDPAVYPLGWANDRYNVGSLMAAGHRRWVLYPSLGFTSYGQVEGIASMKVFGFNQQSSVQLSPEVEYIAYPYREYPYLLVSNIGPPTPWSISMIPPQGYSSSFQHFTNSTVTVTETATGTPLTVHSLHRDTSGYGLRNFLSWMVDDWENDTEYTVTISNVVMQDNSVRQIQYPVRVLYAEYQ